jgi:hypothetical protein
MRLEAKIKSGFYPLSLEAAAHLVQKRHTILEDLATKKHKKNKKNQKRHKPKTQGDLSQTFSTLGLVLRATYLVSHGEHHASGSKNQKRLLPAFS